jgi:hypothetical protein
MRKRQDRERKANKNVTQDIFSVTSSQGRRALFLKGNLPLHGMIDNQLIEAKKGRYPISRLPLVAMHR